MGKKRPPAEHPLRFVSANPLTFSTGGDDYGGGMKIIGSGHSNCPSFIGLVDNRRNGGILERRRYRHHCNK